MFGFYRLLLSLLVVASHLMSITIAGQYAVHGFFILSGFLITRILHKNYGYDLEGLTGFTLNRFLRLYPTYWVFLIASFAVAEYAGWHVLQSMNSSIAIPASIDQWLQNLSMIYLSWTPLTVYPRIIPPTWALTVELIFYGLMAMGLSKNARVTYAWIVLSLAYLVFTYAFENGAELRYSAILAGSLPFSIGACIYHNISLINSKLKLLGHIQCLFVSVLFLAFVIFSGCLIKLFNGPTFFSEAFYWLNLLANAVLIIVLFKVDVPKNIKRLDSSAGEYSYPVYLFHWTAGALAAYLVFGEAKRGFNIDGCIVFIVSLPIMFLISAVVIRFIDKPIQNVRAIIRARTNAH